jgi:pimeloyl-ACP methyl ester carboxylesterase
LWAAARINLPRTSPLWREHPLHVPAVVSVGGLPDLEADRALSPDCGGPALIDALTGARQRHAAASRDTSPARMLPIPARLMMVAGALDPISPPHLTTDFARKAGAKTVVVPGSGHVELIAPGSRAWRTELDLIERALARPPQ